MSEGHFDPATYPEWVRQEIPGYDHLQESIARATASATAATILELGTGTGETLARLLPLHPSAAVIGIDASEGMLNVARARLNEYHVILRVADLLDELPSGPFALVVPALAVHHLDGEGKARLFGRVASVLRPGGRFVLGDVILPADKSSVVVSLTEGHDKPSTVSDQLGWLEDAGFLATVAWQKDDLAVFIADQPTD